MIFVATKKDCAWLARQVSGSAALCCSRLLRAPARGAARGGGGSLSAPRRGRCFGPLPPLGRPQLNGLERFGGSGRLEAVAGEPSSEGTASGARFGGTVLLADPVKVVNGARAGAGAAELHSDRSQVRRSCFMSSLAWQLRSGRPLFFLPTLLISAKRACQPEEKLCQLPHTLSPSQSPVDYPRPAHTSSTDPCSFRPSARPLSRASAGVEPRCSCARTSPAAASTCPEWTTSFRSRPLQRTTLPLGGCLLRAAS